MKGNVKTKNQNELMALTLTALQLDAMKSSADAELTRLQKLIAKGYPAHLKGAIEGRYVVVKQLSEVLKQQTKKLNS